MKAYFKYVIDEIVLIVAGIDGPRSRKRPAIPGSFPTYASAAVRGPGRQLAWVDWKL